MNYDILKIYHFTFPFKIKKTFMTVIKVSSKRLWWKLNRQWGNENHWILFEEIKEESSTFHIIKVSWIEGGLISKQKNFNSSTKDRRSQRHGELLKGKCRLEVIPFCFGAIPGDTQSLSLAFHSGIIAGSGWGTIWVARDQIWGCQV